MKLKAKNPAESFSKQFKKYRPFTDEFEDFRTGLETYRGKIKSNESEEHFKAPLRDLLHSGLYADSYEINTSVRSDLAIFLGKAATSSVGVLFETKRPNAADMVKHNNVNVKALHELVLYYFEERETRNNTDLKHLVATDFIRCFVFDANSFDKHFYGNTKIRNLYKTYKNDKKTNDWFYAELSKLIESFDDEIECVYLDIDEAKATKTKLINIFKILSPYFLLKKPFADDSNTLNKKFYAELLYIIGLEEIKDKSKQRIQRVSDEKRQRGSLIENTITILKTKDSLRHIDNIETYGADSEERYFNVALELCLTWVNRILFLKLLEAQLVGYHGGDDAYKFLNFENIGQFNELSILFHRVLAVSIDERDPDIRQKFERVPYLNSSLFEIGDLEEKTFTIESLRITGQLPRYGQTVLTELKKQNKPLSSLEYLFRFLDAYDFASETAEELRDKNRQLINASVLGKVFEKINGYREGSIYTPGFITMYMCREAIRPAIVAKFNEHYSEWRIETFQGLQNKLARFDEPKKIIEFNACINSMRICDPAVGSGHFLVSALNEIIAIKHELGILADSDGKPFRSYDIAVIDDELDVMDRDGLSVMYKLVNGRPTPELHRFQKALFHEKQTIIENCLFGVDINPNSVKICRLRLWIELLKNAYYKESTDYKELETLPNIDINIKKGNSLISRFALADKFKSEQTNKLVGEYRELVTESKNVRNKDRKDELKLLVGNLQKALASSLEDETQDIKERLKIKYARLSHYEHPTLDFAKISEAELEVKTRVVKGEIAKLEVDLAKVESKYTNAFEWRFEFPEILDDEGNFLGFDVVIGNPPYIRQESIKELKPYLEKNYEVFSSTADILVYFYELGLKILKESGRFAFITSNKFIKAAYGAPLRQFLWKFDLQEIIDFGELPVFDESSTFPVIFQICRIKNNKRVKFTQVKNLAFTSIDELVANESIMLTEQAFGRENWTLASPEITAILSRISKNTVSLKSYLSFEPEFGIKTGLNEVFIINSDQKDQFMSEDPKSVEVIVPFAVGDDIRKFNVQNRGRFLLLIKIGTDIKRYPAIFDYLNQHKEKLEKRWDKGNHWWELRACAYYDDFEKPKIVYPDIAKASRMAFVEEPLYFANSAYMLPTDDKYLLALLNSKLIFFYYSKISSVLGDPEKGGRLRWFTQDVVKIPIKNISIKERSPFTSLVDQILDLKKSGGDTTKLEIQIDAMVYELYDLTPDEIALVEKG